MENQQVQTSVGARQKQDTLRKSKGGKGLMFFPVEGTTFWEIKFADGGCPPKEWANQYFTSMAEAQKAIEKYLGK